MLSPVSGLAFAESAGFLGGNRLFQDFNLSLARQSSEIRAGPGNPGCGRVLAGGPGSDLRSADTGPAVALTSPDSPRTLQYGGELSARLVHTLDGGIDALFHCMKVSV